VKKEEEEKETVKEKEEVEMEAEYAHLLIFSGTRRYSLEEESGLFNFQVFIRRFRVRRDPIVLPAPQVSQPQLSNQPGRGWGLV
jgi:hypothetical protein